MKRSRLIIAATVSILLLAGNITDACTNFLVTKAASTDGSTMISYAADSHVLYGELYFRPAADYPKGTMMKIFDWDSGKYLGEIEQVEHTFSVVGNMNEHQVVIGETTYGGRPELQDTTGIIDYGNLIYITLQRAKNARDAIRIMSELVSKYGYYSSGESMSISDPNEVWIFEIIGKGPGNKGAVWVARMVPDGYICAHANQARITTFPISKKNNFTDPKQTTFHAADVVSFAKSKGLYDGKDAEFSFSDVYAPVDFGGARFCEVRVWSFFKNFSKEFKENKEYWDYAKGNVHHKVAHEEGKALIPANFASNRMPLWIKPEVKISARDIMNNMRDHLEGTELDMSTDLGAGPYACPYRWRPLTWTVGEETYCNERATATQQTGFSFVGQSRSWMPDPIGGIFWFSVDDAASSVYYPVFCGSTKVSEAYASGNGDMMTYSRDAAFWAFNEVSNFAYTRYNVIHPEIEKKQQEIEEAYVKDIADVDFKTGDLFKRNEQEAIAYVTDFSVRKGNELAKDWRKFYEYLFVKYMDGNIKEAVPVPDGYKYIAPKLDQPGYSPEWYKRVADETGEKLKYKGSSH